MYQVGIKKTLQARHFLVGDFAEESIPHEHDYVVEWICTTDVLDENGFSVDISAMEEELGRLGEETRGKLLNDIEFFKGLQPSVENMARYFHARLTHALEQRGFSLESIVESQVKIWESETAWAAYVRP